MAKYKGDALVLRRRTWWLDTWINGKRYRRPLGKFISRAVALKLSIKHRVDILKEQMFLGRNHEQLAREQEQQQLQERLAALGAQADPPAVFKEVLGDHTLITSATLAALQRSPVVYAWTREHTIVYIGMSARGIARALRPTPHDTDAVYVWAQPSPAVARQQEARAIRLLNPTLNKAGLDIPYQKGARHGTTTR